MNHLGDWSWDGMAAFFAAAQCGSLREAAQQLGVSQPTVGRRLDQLEEQLGARLLVRSAGGCQLTPVGQALVPHLRQVAAQAQQMEAAVRHSRSDLRGVVRVACGPLLAQVLARSLPQLLSGASGLELEIGLAAEAADIALQGRPPEPDPSRAQRLGDAPRAVYGAAAYFADRPAALSDDAHRWIGPLPGSAAAGRVADVRLSDPLAILEAAAAGAGLAVLPCFVGEARPELRRRGAIRWGEPRAGLWLVCAEASQDLPRVRLIADRLAALVTNLPGPAPEAVQSPSAD